MVMVKRVNKRLTKQEQRVALLRDEIRVAIEERMTELRMSRAQLAKKLTVTEGRVSQILGGSENLTLESLVKIGSALGVTWEIKAVS